MRTWSVILVAFVACAGAITRDQFYPYGPGVDQRLPRGADVSSPELPLTVPILFYGESYDSIFVNNHGLVSFRAEIPVFMNSEFPLPYPSIAGFYANVDTTQSGNIFYRESFEVRDLRKAEESVQSNFHEFYNFKPSSVFIATWVDVSYTERPDRKNTFQIAIISDGNESFVELLYPESEIQWIQRETHTNNFPDAKAQAGFVAEDGRIFTLRGSGSHQIRNIVSWSNTHEPGKYVYRVGNVPQDGNVFDPDLFNQNDVELEEESKTCAQSGPSVCHTQARCVDYQTGICCKCNEGFYGNGKSCIKDNAPLRVHGKLNGVINDINLDNVDIQAYVVVADGRSYTALSQSPHALGTSLQLLNVLGGVIGWLFARPTAPAKNGYQLTGGLFNHTAEIFFPATGHRVTINQEYQGHDVFDQVTVYADIRGTVPQIFDGTKLEVAEYNEHYTFVDPGYIHSESYRAFTNKLTGENIKQKVTQTFSFQPDCRFAPTSEGSSAPLTLIVTKNYLGYETKEKIVRYGMSNKITPLGQEDPCIEGRNFCGAHSTCVVQGENFDCVCEKGFTQINVDDKRSCVDIDECAVGTHNCDNNADCFNNQGDFQCRCRAGFIGDGVSCQKMHAKCSSKVCDRNAHCVENVATGATCVCNEGFTGDGNSCWAEQPCDQCSPYATCLVDAVNKGLQCKCRNGYYGDGFYCEIITPAPATFRPRPSYPETTQRPPAWSQVPSQPSSTDLPSTAEEVYNDRIVLPECTATYCVCPAGYTNFTDARNNELCRLVNTTPPNYYETTSESETLTCESDTQCPPNALCHFAELNPFGVGQCICQEGYEGDGYECLERTRPSCACEPNAHCVETATGHTCVCNLGYHGDGYNCEPSYSCSSDADCESHASCRPDSTEQNVCQCIEGYTKDANDACIPEGLLCNERICADHASCLFDANIGIRYCHCDAGYEGDGITECTVQGETCDVSHDCQVNSECMLVDNAYTCVCNEGFVDDGIQCIAEVTDCRNTASLCDAHASCLKQNHAFECVCNAGYIGNGSHCEINVLQIGNFLVVADGTSVNRAPLKAGGISTPINSMEYQTAVGVDADCEGRRIYWGDVTNFSIKRAMYDGSHSETFLSDDVKAPEGLSIDWSARNIFWTDARKLTIEVANLDTRNRKVLFVNDGIRNPRGIAVHPQRGKIFWSDWNRNFPKIEWASMDGSNRAVFVGPPEVKLPNSLAIDWLRDRLCYTDAGLFVIKCVHIETLVMEVVAKNLPYPFGLAVKDERIFWTDWKTKPQRIDYYNSRTTERGLIPITTASRKLYGLALAHEQCPAGGNVCQYRNGNCEANHLCLPDGMGGRTCVPANDNQQEEFFNIV